MTKTDLIIGMKVTHGSPGYEEPEVIKDVTQQAGSGRVKVSFESGFVTNMSEYELDVFLDEGEIHYYQHFAGPHDKGLATMKAY
jgi:hypothetical protein